MLIDGHGRTVDYLRISVTQRCNFRCKYCMPKTPFSWEPRENLLSFEELFLFVKVCLDEGVKDPYHGRRTATAQGLGQIYRDDKRAQS